VQGLDQILGTSGMDVGSLAARFGISPEQANAALGSLMPAVAGGMQKRDDEGSLGPVTDAGASIDQPDPGTGNNILGHIFGSKDVSRQVADHAAEHSGVSNSVLKAMLPVVAAMVAKHVAQNGGGNGGLGSVLGSVLGGGQAGGVGSLAGILGGGNPLDAILRGGR
jgi:hypothetical protein